MRRAWIGPVHQNHFADGAGRDGIGPSREVVIIDDVIGAASIKIAGKYHAGQGQVFDHRLNQHLLVSADLSVGRDHPFDGIADCPNQRRHICNAFKAPGVRCMGTIFLGAGRPHRKFLAGKAGDDAIDNVAFGSSPFGNQDDELIAKPHQPELRRQPFKRFGLGSEAKHVFASGGVGCRGDAHRAAACLRIV